MFKRILDLCSHRLIFCANCRTWKWTKPAYRCTMGGILATLCAECEHALYHQWARR